MKVAVVGAEGFIGSHVMQELANEGWWGVGYDLQVGTWADQALDVTWDKTTVTRLLDGCDAIIGLAGVLGTHELFDDVETAIKVNVQGQYNVAWAANHLGVPYVTIEQPHVWTNPYEATRGAGVRLARSLAHHRGLRLATVQAFNAFGPRQEYGPGHPRKIVPTFSVHGWHNKPIEIYGRGDQQVNLVTAKDIARVMIAAIPHAATNSPHFMGAAIGGNMTVNKVADLIASHTKMELAPVHEPMRSGETDDGFGASAQYASLEIQSSLLGVRPTFKIEDLHAAVDWYSKHNL